MGCLSTARRGMWALLLREGSVTSKTYGRRARGPSDGRACGQPRQWAIAFLSSLLLVSWSDSGALRAQSIPSGVAKSYLNKSVLALPILIDPRAQGSLREVQLFGKDDPAKPWTFLNRALTSQKEFQYRAPRDGEYWFAIVTVDRTGRQTPSPADMMKEPPGVIVVVDTTAPRVDLRPVEGADDGTCVQCIVHDDNADPARTRFEYQTCDERWRPLDPMPGRPDTFCIPAEARVTGKVRVEVGDKAGNLAMRETTVDAAPAAASAPEKTARVPASPPAAVSGGPSLSLPSEPERVVQAKHTELENPQPRPRQALEESATQARKADPPKAMPHVPAGQIATAEQPTGSPSALAPGARQVVNSRRVFLEYKIEQTGPSGVGRVQIWMTRDRGQSWELLGEDEDRTSPAEVVLPGEGLFGVTLVVSNGRGFGATPPASGDSPDWWIEVDLTKPTAELVSVVPTENGDPGVMIITWNARDKNLGSEPVDLYWSANRDGPWMTIAKGLRNDRQYRWSVPQEVGAQAYVRMTVTDQARNISECLTAEPVAIDDLSRPRVRVVGVSTVAPSTGPILLPDH